jgi:hypothetical protein
VLYREREHQTKQNNQILPAQTTDGKGDLLPAGDAGNSVPLTEVPASQFGAQASLTWLLL